MKKILLNGRLQPEQVHSPTDQMLRAEKSFLPASENPSGHSPSRSFLFVKKNLQTTFFFLFFFQLRRAYPFKNPQTPFLPTLGLWPKFFHMLLTFQTPSFFLFSWPFLWGKKPPKFSFILFSKTCHFFRNPPGHFLLLLKNNLLFFSIKNSLSSFCIFQQNVPAPTNALYDTYLTLVKLGQAMMSPAIYFCVFIIILASSFPFSFYHNFGFFFISILNFLQQTVAVMPPQPGWHNILPSVWKVACLLLLSQKKKYLLFLSKNLDYYSIFFSIF